MMHGYWLMPREKTSKSLLVFFFFFFFYLADGAYGFNSGVLVPDRGTRYHPIEQAFASKRPQNAQELYKLHDALLRNVIEGVGVF